MQGIRCNKFYATNETNRYIINDKTMEHIFYGEVVNGSPQGFHHYNPKYSDNILRIIKRIKIDGSKEVDLNIGKNIFDAKVALKGKRIPYKTSSFFPEDWDRIEVIDVIKSSIESGICHKYGIRHNHLFYNCYGDKKKRILIACYWNKSTMILSTAFPIKRY